ncbi:hypothetical protein [Flavobacterium alvei]|nr:hypothetical protein [Flavobacterium alvei]
MKKILLFALITFTLGCSKDETVISDNKMESDFVIEISQSRQKRSDNEFQIGWSDWEKEESKIIWNAKKKELTIVYFDGQIDIIQNCNAESNKVSAKIEDIKGDGIDDWIENPTEIVFDFNNDDLIRSNMEFDSQHDTNGNGILIVSRITSDVELRVKK